MLNLIERYDAKCIDLKRSDGSKYAPDDWRVFFVGQIGVLDVFEIEELSGKHLIRFDVRGLFSGKWMKSGPGVITKADNLLLISTKNSVYTFEIEKQMRLI